MSESVFGARTWFEAGAEADIHNQSFCTFKMYFQILDNNHKIDYVDNITDKGTATSTGRKRETKVPRSKIR